MHTALLLAADDPTHPLYFLTAFGAGVISFLSPCVLPIVPAYLSLITGLTVGDLQEGDTKVLTRIAVDTGLFVAGFTVVFVLLGLITTAAGDVLFENQATLTRISGALVILMALYLAGSQILMAPRMYQEFRFHPHLDRFGKAATPIAGVGVRARLDAVHRAGARRRALVRRGGPEPAPGHPAAGGLLGRARSVRSSPWASPSASSRPRSTG